MAFYARKSAVFHNNDDFFLSLALHYNFFFQCEAFRSIPILGQADIVAVVDAASPSALERRKWPPVLVEGGSASSGLRLPRLRCVLLSHGLAICQSYVEPGALDGIAYTETEWERLRIMTHTPVLPARQRSLVRSCESASDISFCLGRLQQSCHRKRAQVRRKRRPKQKRQANGTTKVSRRF